MDGMIRGEHLHGQDNWTEEQLTALVVDAIESLGLARHLNVQKGFLDLLIIGAKGVIYRELKSPSGRLTPEERTWIVALNAAGEDADVWRPADWPERILSELRYLGKIEVELPGPSKAALAKFYASEDRRTAEERRRDRQLAKEARTHSRK